MGFPTEVWDRTTLNRTPSKAANKSPNFEDFGALAAEVIAAQTKLGIGTRESGTAEASVAEVSDLSVQRTILTLSDLDIICVDGGTKEYGGALLHTFPKGAIKVLGITLNLVLTSSDYAAAEEGDLSLGEVIATDQALSGTDVTWLAAAALTFGSGTVTVTAQGDIVAINDGTTTPRPVYLNVCMDNASGLGTITVNGTVTIHWCNLGDY